jgi:hypothetical protein
MDENSLSQMDSKKLTSTIQTMASLMPLDKDS